MKRLIRLSALAGAILAYSWFMHEFSDWATASNKRLLDAFKFIATLVAICLWLLICLIGEVLRIEKERVREKRFVEKLFSAIAAGKTISQLENGRFIVIERA